MMVLILSNPFVRVEKQWRIREVRLERVCGCVKDFLPSYTAHLTLSLITVANIYPGHQTSVRIRNSMSAHDPYAESLESITYPAQMALVVMAIQLRSKLTGRSSHDE